MPKTGRERLYLDIFNFLYQSVTRMIVFFYFFYEALKMQTDARPAQACPPSLER